MNVSSNKVVKIGQSFDVAVPIYGACVSGARWLQYLALSPKVTAVALFKFPGKSSLSDSCSTALLLGSDLLAVWQG